MTPTPLLPPSWGPSSWKKKKTKKAKQSIADEFVQLNLILIRSKDCLAFLICLFSLFILRVHL